MSDSETTTRFIHTTFRCRGDGRDFDRYSLLIKRLGRQYGIEVVDHRTEPPLAPIGEAIRRPNMNNSTPHTGAPR